MRWLKKVAATPLTTIAKVIDSLAEIQNERTNAPSIHATRAGINAVSAALDDAQAQINEEINDVKADLDDTNTELGGVSDGLTALTAALNEVWKTIYPVGSIYINANDVNPATLFGGTWEKIQDRFLLASSSTYAAGATGGAASISVTPQGTVGGHALTVPELPKHIHLYAPYYPRDTGVMASFYNVASGNDVQIPKIAKNIADYEDWTIDNIFYNGTQKPDKTEHAENAAHSHDFTGTETTVDTLPPYLAVNVWKRTA